MSHPATPAPGDFFKLQSTCSDCGERVYYRLGTGEWEHA